MIKPPTVEVPTVILQEMVNILQDQPHKTVHEVLTKLMQWQQVQQSEAGLGAHRRPDPEQEQETDQEPTH